MMEDNTRKVVYTFRSICTAQVNWPEADFWIQPNGRNIGQPHKEFLIPRIGIKVNRPDILLPDFLWYYFEHLWVEKAYSGEKWLRPDFFNRLTFAQSI